MVGHCGHECPNGPKSETAHVAQEEEALMMVITAVVSHSSPSATPVSDEGGEAMASRRIRGLVDLQAGAVEQKRWPVHLHDEKVSIQLRSKKKRTPKIWIYDTRATNTCRGPGRYSRIWT
jgi:hypothetical protein